MESPKGELNHRVSDGAMAHLSFAALFGYRNNLHVDGIINALQLDPVC